VKRFIFAAAVFSLSLFLSNAAHATSYYFTWDCNLETCTFSAASVPNLLDYYWDLGDLTFDTQQNETHTYTPCCGADFYYPRVTLTFHLSNGSYINRRCYITYYSSHVGGDPTPSYYSGTCATFN
jgi:hypothetical protein